MKGQGVTVSGHSGHTFRRARDGPACLVRVAWQRQQPQGLPHLHTHVRMRCLSPVDIRAASKHSLWVAVKFLQCWYSNDVKAYVWLQRRIVAMCTKLQRMRDHSANFNNIKSNRRGAEICFSAQIPEYGDSLLLPIKRDRAVVLP